MMIATTKAHIRRRGVWRSFIWTGLLVWKRRFTYTIQSQNETFKGIQARTRVRLLRWERLR